MMCKKAKNDVNEMIDRPFKGACVLFKCIFEDTHHVVDTSNII